MDASSEAPVLVAGATGYVGGRLVPELLRRGFRVRCMVRDDRKLDGRPWRHKAGVEIVRGEISDADALLAALQGCESAFYLVHPSFASGEPEERGQVDLANSFAEACEHANVSRIISVGVQGSEEDPFVRRRREIEHALASRHVSLTVLRVSMIIGSGSAAFEILRSLVERLPFMVAPRWIRRQCQPLAISDLIYWLAECLSVPATAGERIDVGGPDILSYEELMQLTANLFGLKPRRILHVPVVTPRVSSAWISLVTPVTYRVARPYVEQLRQDSISSGSAAQKLMPLETLPVRTAIRRAISKTADDDVLTRWSTAGVVQDAHDWTRRKTYVDARSIEIDAEPPAVFAAVCRIGGGHGWYAGDILWRIRGWMDQVVGGPGLRRGRRKTDEIEFGETLDFWRVIGLERNRSLLLRAEMKVPGEAWLQFEVTPKSSPTTRLTMTARFQPSGWLGIAYWYAVVPLHNFVFAGMLNGIKRTAETIEQQAPKETSSEPALTQSAASARQPPEPIDGLK